MLIPVMREHMATNNSRMDMLLGLATPQQNGNCNGSAYSEFEEKDVWDAAEGRDWGDATTSVDFETRKYEIGGYGNRRWHLEKDPGLSSGYPDAVRTRSVGLSPLHRVSANIPNGLVKDSRTQARLIPNREAKPSLYSHVMSESHQHMHQSAPVNVPDWSKILGTERKSKEFADEITDAKMDDEDDERLPPHELLEREYARSQISTFSMCEGAGRTLKGRDLSRVRNAVLRKTGFLND